MLKMIKLNLPFQNLMYKYCLSPIYIFNKIEIFIKFGAKPRILRILIFICLHSEKYLAILRPINHRPKIHVQYSWLDNVRILKMSGVLWKNIQSFMGKQNCFPFRSMWWVPIEWFGCQIILVLGQRTSFLICPFMLAWYKMKLISVCFGGNCDFMGHSSWVWAVQSTILNDYFRLMLLVTYFDAFYAPDYWLQGIACVKCIWSIK